MAGWVKLHRKLSDNPIWFCEKFTRGQAWVDLILLANHQDSFFYKRGVKIDVKRGQVGRSEVELSDRWKWSRSKVRKFLNDLEKEQQIEQHKTNVTQLVTLINYDDYQQKEQQTEQQKDSRKTAKEQQKDTYKNVKKEKNVNNDNNINPLSFSYEKFIILFNEITGRTFRGDSKSKGHFNQRIKNYNAAEFGIAIRNAHKDEYLRQNPKYLTPEYISRENQLEKWLNVVEGVKGNGQTRKQTAYDINPDIKNNPDRMKFK